MVWFMVSLQEQQFVSYDFDDLLLQLSSAWHLYNTLKESSQKKAEDEKEKKDKPQDNSEASGCNFLRKTTKYWVPADKVMELKLSVLKHLPINTFTQRSESLITSVYYDSEDLSLYQ